MAESSAVKKGPVAAGDGPRHLRARRGGAASARGASAGGRQVSRATGSTQTMMRLYTDDAPGLKVDPVVVLVLSLVFIASRIVWLVASAAMVLGQSEPCNGHVELCARPYNNVSFACTHNSYSSPPPNALLVLNQENSIEQQLNDGIRAFMLDVVRNKPVATDGTSNIFNTIASWFSHAKNADDPLESVHLCHESCLLIDKGPLVDSLTVIREFMDANPREIITFIIENVSGFSPTDLQPSFEQSGIASYAFAPEFAPESSHSGYKWPTLNELIAQNTRLVVFMDDKADVTLVPYILPEWEYVVEIPYANVNPVTEFPCNQDRPYDGVPRDLVVMNHFVYNRATLAGKNIDTPISAKQVEEHAYNSLDSLDKHWQTCRSVWGNRVLNFVTLDFYNIGDGGIFKLVDQINGVST
ncbi:hypothetical protein LPJ62_000199 [Coemansia sp. RSA 2167]|nr:hypothetical protein LPJ62_000199 [Coemansia sp. RSA 2167]